MNETRSPIDDEHFTSRPPSWLATGSPGIAVWWQFFRGQELSFEFESLASGTRVRVKARLAAAFGSAIDALGDVPTQVVNG
jgi:hypothetical protein